LGGNCQNSIPKVFIATPIHGLCVNFVKIGKVVRYLPHKNTPRCLALPSSRIAPKICQGQRQTMFSERSQISCKSTHFGRSYSRTRVNTVKTHRKVFAIFGSWSRIIILYVLKSLLHAVNCGRLFWHRQSAFCLCVKHLGEPLNGFAPNSHETRVWSLVRRSLNGQRSRSPGTKRQHFRPYQRPACGLCLVKHL